MRANRGAAEARARWPSGRNHSEPAGESAEFARQRSELFFPPNERLSIQSIRARDKPNELLAGVDEFVAPPSPSPSGN